MQTHTAESVPVRLHSLTYGETKTYLFAALFIEQVVKKENRAPGAAGLVCAVAGLAVFGADNMVIPAMVLTLAVLLLGRRKLCA